MAKLEPRGRKVKILATVGPSSRDPEMLRRLFRAGVDAFRINMSHGEHATHAPVFQAIRGLEKEFAWPIAILADLQGPKLRVGTFVDGRALIPHGAEFTLDRDETPGDASRVCLPHPELFGLLEPGQRLLVNDGKIRLRVLEADKRKIHVKAEVGGVISDRKGVNVPDAEIPIPAMTEKDRRDLAFAVEHGADWIALSFVQRPRGSCRGAPADRRARRQQAGFVRQDREAAGGPPARRDHPAFRRGDGGARRPRCRTRARGRAAAAEEDRQRDQADRQAGDRRDADARIDDREPRARPAPRSPMLPTRSMTGPTR